MGLAVIVALIPMASNGTPHFERFVFPLQSNVAAGEAGRRFGGQDKGRISSARTGTPQPAPHTKLRRPHRLNTTAPRSKNKPTPKRKTVHLTIWIDPRVKGELQRLAAQEGLTVSKTAAAFLEQALQNNVDMQYSALLTPIIEAAIEKRMRARDARLSWLLTRNAFAVEQTRTIVANI
jgi:hypothetical protein